MNGKLRTTSAGLIGGFVVAVFLFGASGANRSAERVTRRALGEIVLARPATTGKMTVEAALAGRRSVRRFSRRTFTLAEIGQLLWAAEGLNDRIKGLRTAPSAGATYPLELYVAVPDGHFRYLPRQHRLERMGRKDIREEIAEAAVKQEWMADAAVIVVIAADFQRTSAKYGDRAIRYVHFETGHVAQNLLLQATALGFGAVPVGAFFDDEIADLLRIPEGQTPLYIVCVGHR